MYIAAFTANGDKGIRTLDPHVANVVLSQLSYTPTGFERYYRTNGIILHPIPKLVKLSFISLQVYFVFFPMISVTKVFNTSIMR